MKEERQSVAAYPLQWPDGWQRTPAAERRTSQFKATTDKARTQLLNEVARMGGTLPIISSNVPLRADGQMRADREPVDPGVAIYFQRAGKSLVFACDTFDMVRENLRALALTINALRGIERWGASQMMERAFSGFKQLEAENAGPSWWSVLQIDAHATASQVEEAYRRLARIAHPDSATGSHDAMAALNFARDQGLAAARGRTP